MPENKLRQYKIWEPMALALAVIVGMIAGVKLTDSAHRSIGIEQLPNERSEAERLTEMIRFIEEKYVDDIDSDALVEKAVRSILSELDPHSGYIPPEELKELNEKMEGHFDGIGIEFHPVGDSVVVLFVNPDGPASKAGMKALDRIVTVDDSTLVGIDVHSRKAVQRLRGVKGSIVKVEIHRPGVDSLITLEIVRDVIPIENAFGVYLPEDTTGYIRLNRFSSTTYRDFMDVLEPMIRQQGMRHLILDLRQNPGGYLKEAVNILSQFFDEKGLLLVYTEGDHTKRMEYRSTGNNFFSIGNIAILIDGNAASASEIVAGAVQDQDRGVVIGTKSYGKGLVQEQYLLKNGGALRLTTARYYTPSGRSIQTPYINGESVNGNGSGIDSSQYFTRNGREVWASGGIEPDIYVESLVNWQDSVVQEMYNLVIAYALYACDFEKPDTSKPVDTFIQHFPAQDMVEKEVLAFMETFETPLTREQVSDHWDVGFILLKSMLASHYFGRDAWMYVMSQSDPVVLKALDVVKEDRRVTLKY